MNAVMIATAAAVVGLGAGDALACSIIIPVPGPGETLLQSSIRGERREQRRLRARASHVYLARVVDRGERAYFEPVISIDGSSPPRRVSVIDDGNCGTTLPAAGEVRIVFARRFGFKEFPWRPWLWGQGTAIGSRLPGEVIDGELAAALRRAAGSD